MLQPFIGLIDEPVTRLMPVLMDHGSGCLRK
jgi:hypothetical protein